MTTSTFTLPTENSTITNRLNDFINSINLPVKSLDITFNSVKTIIFKEFCVSFLVEFSYVYMDSEECDFYTENDDFIISIATNDINYYDRFRGIDKNGNVDGRVADEAEIEFIENNMETILNSIEYKLRWFFRELR